MAVRPLITGSRKWTNAARCWSAGYARREPTGSRRCSGPVGVARSIGTLPTGPGTAGLLDSGVTLRWSRPLLYQRYRTRAK